MNEPWSKRHKREFKHCKFSLSGSFAQPLSMPELVEKVRGSGGADLIEQYLSHNLEYVPNGGSADLRGDIARVIYDDRIPAENVLVFPGGQVAIQTAALAFASRGAHSIVFAPGYQSTVESPRWAVGNGGVTELRRRAENGWQVDPRELEGAIRPNTEFLILNEPYNPGGVVMSAGLQEEVIGICRRHRVTILCDEVYRLLEHDDNLRLPTMACAYERGISAVTMSKPWGGCGITIGWLACQDKDMVQRMVDVQYFGTSCVSRASELQARMVLRVSPIILSERRGIILKNKELLQDFVEIRYSEWFEWRRPNAGAIAFVKFKGPWTSDELGRHLATANISIKPAYCFTDQAEAKGVDEYFRVGFGVRNMALALQALGEFVDEHEESWRAIMHGGKLTA